MGDLGVCESGDVDGTELLVPDRECARPGRYYRLDRTLETVSWEAQAVDRLLGTRTTAVVCVHGAHVHGGGLHAYVVAIVPAHLLHRALGYERVLSDTDIDLLATTAWTSSARPPDRDSQPGARGTTGVAGRPTDTYRVPVTHSTLW
jgi:hypothetical protein